MSCDGCGHGREQHVHGYFHGCDAAGCYCMHFANAVAEADYRDWIDSTGMST